MIIHCRGRDNLLQNQIVQFKSLWDPSPDKIAILQLDTRHNCIRLKHPINAGVLIIDNAIGVLGYMLWTLSKTPFLFSPINTKRNIWTIVNDLRKDPYKRETLSKPIDSTFAETSKQSLFTFSSSWAGLLLSVRWENPREPLWEARQKVGPRIEYGLPCQPTWTSIYNMLSTWILPGDYLGTTWGLLED